MGRPQDFVLHASLGDGGTEEVLRLNLGGDFFPQCHRLSRGIDRDFVFRLLVFFDPETAPLMELIHHQQAVITQHGTLRQREFAFNSAELVSLVDLLEDLFTLRIVDLNREVLITKRSGIQLIILRLLDPELELDGLFRAINRTIRDREYASCLIVGIVTLSPPGVSESGIGQSAFRGSCHHQPLVVVADFL